MRRSFGRYASGLLSVVSLIGAAWLETALAEGIEAPSAYVEGIETPGDGGGVMEESDAATAQAEAAEAAAKKGSPDSSADDEDGDEQ